MKIYLAANYAAKDWMREIRIVLQDLGHEVTSRWIDQLHEDRSIENQRLYAEQDLYDIYKSEALVIFSDSYGLKPGRGKFIEFGAAHCMGKKLFVVGLTCEESVFFFLRDVKRFQYLEQFYVEMAPNEATPAISSRVP